MAFDKKSAMVLVVVVALMASLQLSSGVVYKVGDSTGWTTMGNYNYTNWAATKTFLVGDVIVFNYNKQYHNVMQVTHAQFRSCNVSSPLVTMATGNDSITIKKNGHFYFLCGVPGHCEAGQKVDIRVLASSAMPPSLAMPPSSGGAASATSPGLSPSDVTSPGPSHKNDAALYSKGLEMAVLAVAVFASLVAL